MKLHIIRRTNGAKIRLWIVSQFLKHLYTSISSPPVTQTLPPARHRCGTFNGWHNHSGKKWPSSALNMKLTIIIAMVFPGSCQFPALLWAALICSSKVVIFCKWGLLSSFEFSGTINIYLFILTFFFLNVNMFKKGINRGTGTAHGVDVELAHLQIGDSKFVIF